MSSNPVREWGSTLLLLGSIVAVIAIAFSVAQYLIQAADPRTYGFANTAIGAVWFAAMLCALGAVLRTLDYLATPRPRRSRAHLRPR